MDLHQYRDAFIADAREQLALLSTSLQILHTRLADGAALEGVRRAFHTLKGTSGTMQYAALSAFCGERETEVKTLLDSKGTPSPENLTAWDSSLAHLQKEIDAIAGG